MKGKTLAGLISAAIVVRRKMASTPPLVPVDTRNLDHSWFVVTAKNINDGNSPSFKGEDKGEMVTKHQEVIGEEKKLANLFIDEYADLRGLAFTRKLK